MKKFILLKLLVLFLMMSCFNGADDLFIDLVTVKNVDCLPKIWEQDTKSDSAYSKLYRMGETINSFLLEKAILNNKTKYMLCPQSYFLSDGDIAICLLLDINKISDDTFLKLMPSDLVDEYNLSGSIIWWNWIQNNENRKWVIEQFRMILKN